MISKKSCLVTGASGFIGTAVANAFSRAGYTLFGIDPLPPENPKLWKGFSQRTILEADIDKLIENKNIDVICHLAGGSSVPQSMHDPISDFGKLLPGTAKLLHWNGTSKSHARFVLFSSAAVYGNPKSLPIDEAFAPAPISPYGIHKHAAEVMAEGYSRMYGFDVAVLRIFSAYGPGLRKQVVWDICKKISDAKKCGANSIELFGTGEESRDFIFVDDIAEAALCASQEIFSGHNTIINLGSGEEHTIRQIGESIIKAFGANINISFSGSGRPGDPDRWLANTHTMERIGFFPKVNLEAGILKTVSSFINSGA